MCTSFLHIEWWREPTWSIRVAETLIKLLLCLFPVITLPSVAIWNLKLVLLVQIKTPCNPLTMACGSCFLECLFVIFKFALSICKIQYMIIDFSLYYLLWRLSGTMSIWFFLGPSLPWTLIKVNLLVYYSVPQTSFGGGGVNVLHKLDARQFAVLGKENWTTLNLLTVVCGF